MRILVSNPDTIGDLVLRQPLYAALRQAGHELMLIVRESVRPLVPYVAPEASCLTLPYEPYSDDLAGQWQRFDELFEQVRGWRPQSLVVAPFRWTLFEERLADELAGIPRYGMSGQLYAGDPHAGLAPESRLRFDVRAEVREEQPELAKYERLASAILGRDVELPDPQLRADELSLDQARCDLERHGLEPGGFWIAAVAGTRNVPLKRWLPGHWGEVLAHWSRRFGRRFVFVGLPEERPLIDAVRESMGNYAVGSPLWDGAGGLSELLALTALSAGYAGHDSGPMHLAAASGKPVLAVFGGGTWPRFVPAVSPSCAITVGVPCAGCGWACAFARPHCIESVPTDEVKRAVEDLENGRIAGREKRVLAFNGQQHAEMVREAADRLRLQVRQTAELSRELQETRQAYQAEVVRYRSELQRQLVDLQANTEAKLRENARSAEKLHETIQKLEGRIVALEPKPTPPREPWKIRLAKRLAGKAYYSPRRAPRPLPTITIVTPVKNGGGTIRQTIESVLGQNYPDLEYLVVDGGSTDDTLRIIDEYRDRIATVISEPDEGMYDALGKGFALASGQVLGYLNADDVFEPGGLLRVGEYFRDHPRAQVIYHEDTVTMDGWRFPNVAQPRVDVYKLLAGHTLFQDGVFFRKFAYEFVGGVDRQLKRAGDWELWLRLARKWGLRRVSGHVSSFRVRKGQISEDRAAYEAERNEARRRFLSRFWLPGIVRCRLVRACNAVRNAIEGNLIRRRMFWPIDYCGTPYPPGEIPIAALGHPINPITGRAPNRLLFSTRDTRFGDSGINYVYYDSRDGIALAYPPMKADRLNELYERHYSNPATRVVEPNPTFHSPYRNFRGGNIVERNLSRLPSPWWWFHKVRYHDATAQEILRSVRQWAPPSDAGIRFLDVGCFEGALLEELKAATQWKLFGLETNASAVVKARTKGHQVWEASAEDAVWTIPEGEQFDLIFLGQTIEHLDDPLAALKRLRLLLSPNGAIVIGTPNLDSKQVELFGPTWAHWHLPYHRTILSRRALRRMARLAGLRVEHLRTRTHPYWTVMTIQLNRLGLGAVVPHTAYFPPVINMHGVRLAGWCRLLWDWWGKGDYMLAVLRQEGAVKIRNPKSE